MSACGKSGWWQITEHAAVRLVCIKESHPDAELHGAALSALNGVPEQKVLVAWSDLPAKPPKEGRNDSIPKQPV